MSLLDQIIAGHGSPQILAVNNDLRTIDYVAGSNDPAEMLKMSRQSGKQGMIEAALKRANLDVTNGKVSLMVAGENSWHKLGVNIAAACSSADAARLSGLDGWTVVKLPMTYDFGGKVITSEDTYAIIRSDNGRQLGTTGKRYQPIQNAEMFSFLDGVLGEFGAKYSSAGACDGGKQVFMTVELPDRAFTVNGTDTVYPRCVFTGDHSGLRTNRCFPTTHRPVCQNTTRLAVQEDGAKGIRIRHTGDIKTKTADAQRALGFAVEQFDAFKESAQVMAAKPLAVRPYTESVLDAVLGSTTEKQSLMAELLKAHKDDEADKIGKELKRREEILTDIISRYESSTNGVNGMRGTAWAGFNAISEYANHHRIGRQVGTPEDRQSRRMESVLSGQGDELIQVAYQQAMSA